MKKQLALALGSLTTLAALFVSPDAAQATPPAPCVATYADIDLASRSMSWGVYCPDGGRVFVDTALFYGNEDFVQVPDQGAHVLVPGESWTIWSQDNTHTGAADHGVLHIVQENGNGPVTVLAHKVR